MVFAKFRGVDMGKLRGILNGVDDEDKLFMIVFLSRLDAEEVERAYDLPPYRSFDKDEQKWWIDFIQREYFLFTVFDPPTRRDISVGPIYSWEEGISLV